eukprot:gene8252-840_t
MANNGFHAFEVHSIVQWRSVPFHIQSVELNGTDLLVGTSQGQLLVYDLPEGSVGAVPSLRLTKKDFLKTSRKPPISQLHAVPELNLLLCLADAYVHVHELSSFTSLCVLEKSKGSLFFAADLKVRGDAAADVHRRSGICRSIPADRLDLRVCCVVKRRLQVFELRAGGSFQHIKELPLPDVPQTVVWCGRKLLIDTGRVVEIPTESPGHVERLAVRLPGNKFALTAERNGRPLVVFKDIGGAALESFAVEWEDWPKAIACILIFNDSFQIWYQWPDVYDPYILGVTDKGVEVRFKDHSSKLVQHIPLENPTYLVQGHAILIASASVLWQLHPVPFPRQVDQLLELNAFIDAKKIEAAMPGTPDERLRRRYNMDKAHAYYEFNRKKNFKAALDLLKGIEVSPITVLRLYPWLLPKKHENRGEPMMSIQRLSEQDKAAATEALILYLTEKRSQLQKLEKNGISSQEKEKQLQLLSIVDTTLLICYLATNSSLLKSFVRVPNHCDIMESEKELKAANKIEELVLLYQNRGLHQKALELLRSDVQRTPDPAVMDTVAFNEARAKQVKSRQSMLTHLQTLKAEHIDIVLEYADTIIKENQREGLAMLTTEDYPNVKTWPRVPIMRHLQQKFPDILIEYLEFVINKWGDTSKEIHTALAHAYINNLISAGSIPPRTEPKRQKLYDFLRLSQHIDVSQLMRIISSTPSEFVEERALLLGRLGRHTEALRIITHEVKDPMLAEEYCCEHFDIQDVNRRNLFMILLEHYLRPSTGTPDTFHALEVLRKHSDKVNPLKAVDMLPLTTKDFMTAILAEREHKRREMAVHTNLAKMEQLQETLYQVSQRRMIIHSKHFKVTEDSKPIRTHAFAVYPCGIYVHLHCMEHESTCPRHNTQGRCKLLLN